MVNTYFFPPWNQTRWRFRLFSSQFFWRFFDWRNDVFWSQIVWKFSVARWNVFSRSNLERNQTRRRFGHGRRTFERIYLKPKEILFLQKNKKKLMKNWSTSFGAKEGQKYKLLNNYFTYSLRKENIFFSLILFVHFLKTQIPTR